MKRPGPFPEGVDNGLAFFHLSFSPFPGVQYAEYRQIRNEMRELHTVKVNIDRLLMTDKPNERKKDERLH